MFKEWGFLLTEIWFLVLLAGLVGLIAGWFIWGGRKAEAGATASSGAGASQQAAAQKAELEKMAAKLDRCRTDGARKDDRIREIEGELDELRGRAAFTAPVDAFEPDDPDDETLRRYDQDTGWQEGDEGASDAETTVPVASDAPETEAEGEAEGEGGAEAAPEIGTRPVGLDGPRDGAADDLKRIKGVGPKMEKLVNSLGFYHFDQIAAWTAEEIAWVDDNLEGFKGRVTRDDWVAQAKDLAAK